jgi:hypothetical protein
MGPTGAEEAESLLEPSDNKDKARAHEEGNEPRVTVSTSVALIDRPSPRRPTPSLASSATRMIITKRGRVPLECSPLEKSRLAGDSENCDEPEGGRWSRTLHVLGFSLA